MLRVTAYIPHFQPTNVRPVGKAGNPDVMAGITEGMVVGVNTEAIAGEGLIVTSGAFDAHVHFICPQLIDEAAASGMYQRW